MKKKKPDLCSRDDVMDELELLRMAEYLDPSDDNDTLCNAKSRIASNKQVESNTRTYNKGVK